MTTLQFVFSTVNYQSIEQTKELIESFLRTFDHNFDRLVVVNNSNDWEKFDQLASSYRKFSSVTFFNDGINRGYMQSAVAGIDRLLDNEKLDADNFFVMNNDIVFSGTRQDWESVLKPIFASGEAGCVGIRVVSGEGIIQGVHLHKRPTILSLVFWLIVTSHYVIFQTTKFLLNRARMALRRLRLCTTEGHVDACQMGMRHVYAVHGSIFSINSDILKILRNLDYPKFYAEEMVVAEICENRGFACIYTEDVGVTHMGSQSFNEGSEKRRVGYMHASIMYYLSNSMYQPKGSDLGRGGSCDD